MPIFHPNCFTERYLREQQDALKARDLQTLERSALALELVGRLQKHGLDFIFKGGTSLMLLFDAPKRLSIDVDINCLEPLGRLSEVLDLVVAEPPFKSWEHQNLRDREAPPTKHFQLYYNSITQAGSQTPSIQLDVIEADNPYTQTVKQPLSISFLENEEAINVIMPSASSLLGDKLAAFAPSTIGYPYQPLTRTGEDAEPRPIKVLKHLFDLGELATIATQFSDCVNTYQNVFAEQLKFRDRDFTQTDSLDDTQDAAFWVSRIGGKKLPQEQKLEFLASGIKALDSHLFNQPFKRAESRLAAGRAALVAEMVRQSRIDINLPNFLNTALDLEHLKSSILIDSWTDLNTIKGTDTAAYACWEMAQRIRQEG